MMDGWSGERLLDVIEADLTRFQQRDTETVRSIEDSLRDNLSYLRSLVTQNQGRNSGPLLPKTPKVSRKKAVLRIETIQEDEVTDFEATTTERTIGVKDDEAETVAEEPTGRTRRTASKKAADSIKRQQSLNLNTKLRRNENNDTEWSSGKVTRSSRSKRPKGMLSSSDEEEENRPSKHSKVEKKPNRKRNTVRASKEPEEVVEDKAEDEEPEQSVRVKKGRTLTVKRKHQESRTPSPRRSKHSSVRVQEPVAKKRSVFNETVDRPIGADDYLDTTLHEDTIGKPTMNSTVTMDKHSINTTVTLDKNSDRTVILDKNSVVSKAPVFDKILMMNTTVVLEPLPPGIHKNKTRVVGKSSTSKSNSRENSTAKESGSCKTGKHNAVFSSPPAKSTRSSGNGPQVRLDTLKDMMSNEDFENLLTEDESSPETTMHRKGKANKRLAKPTGLGDGNGVKVTSTKLVKNMYKPNALFSPYAKDSVRKRVEAFEQVGLNSPKSVEIDAPTRVTRTKTRAMAAAEAAVNPAPPVLTVTQKLARKSLAKAKKISLAKHMRQSDDYKENQNASGSLQKPSRNLLAPMLKQQQRTTPIGKSLLQQPMSVNRTQRTPSNLQPLSTHSRAMSASRANIVTVVDTFIQQPRTVQKANLTEKLEEKRRRAHEEDARRKREEALKAVSEEKRRKREEKELKNKLAREAKEKLDMEKRLKAEREREEKARIALQMQERQREEVERKRLAQQQRAQQKEEKRRQEEHLRLQRLQEQEEAERQLAEQKRKEQEAAERQHQRRLAEARAHQQAATETNKLKAQYLAAQAKAKDANATFIKPQAVNGYVIDSEPDDDVSDEETKPKHSIPHWAQGHVRKAHLGMQEYIPRNCVHIFFDSKQCTPDLTNLFTNIDKSKLKRTSSANWKTPPRYSMMYRE